jgi:hypothetical protein
MMIALKKFACVAFATSLGVALSLTPAQRIRAQDGLGSSRVAGSTLPQTLSSDGARNNSYIQLPLQELEHTVPGLKGLKADDSQKDLPEILAKVAGTIANLLPRLPDIVSREDIYHFQSEPDPNAPGGLAGAQPWSREFKFLLLCRHNSNGSTSIVESRIDGSGRPITEVGPFTSLEGYGFAYQWLFFSAANQPEFRFRSIGQQEKNGKKTFVVAFAQVPGMVSDPAQFEWQGKRAPFYFQGILWVDQNTFEIVSLRSDLLAPLEQLHLRKLTTELTFGSVPIKGYNAVFWLPRSVYISSDQGAGPAEESHRYSDYHLFHAQATIMAAP